MMHTPRQCNLPLRLSSRKNVPFRRQYRCRRCNRPSIQVQNEAWSNTFLVRFHFHLAMMLIQIMTLSNLMPIWLSLSPVLGQLIIMPQNNFQPLLGQAKSKPINLTAEFNNKAFGLTPGEADYDGSRDSYPAAFIPSPTFVYAGLKYEFSTYRSKANDNVIASGQKISVPKGRYISAHMLAASENGMAQGFLNATYVDGTAISSPVLVPAWWSWPYPTGGDLVFPYRLTNETKDYNRSNIFQTSNWLDSSKEINTIILPNVTGGSATDPGGAAIEARLHIFALTLVPAATEAQGPELSIQYARSTQKWLEGSSKTQVFEVIVNNMGSDHILANNSVVVSIDSAGVETVEPGYIKRLPAGDQARVVVGVKNRLGVASGSSGNATVTVDGKGITNSSYTFKATYGIKDYEPTYESVYSHESPDWYNDGKYGIFIHWGVYAVPGWGNSGKNEGYAEWYWWSLNSGPNTSTATYEYHLEKYGTDVVYDDFIQNFTASAFDPEEWVDLFADAGATYFVQVSKHHDGYAIFDLPENVTKRTSVAQHPHRNLLQELFDASDKYQPQLHKATYYSLPEWFHPDYNKYGFASWPGGNATNPFTNKTLPYAGYVPVSDYITDVIMPEMNTLASMGTEIMWCDIGGPNKTTEFASAWFNTLAQSNKQAVMNARCGLPGDFDTPEYARYASVQPRKWESNLGMDPFSYGYNRATPLASYMNATMIVQSLVDVVSKNGNFLLDIGPMANGTILDVEKENLRKAGTWIKSHAEAVFNTTYWYVTPQEGDNIRFTTTRDAFYVLVMEKPNSNLALQSPIPWVPGDEVKIVGGSMAGKVVPSSRGENGAVVLEVTGDVAAADQYTWVFKIEY
ncbi:glycoside hydrolase superfamily [Clohesyomyces aquaticus]|uniref:alpha-L-fucosidase n=1 Tax=Clohesyomyces aquaticus TaxID=1231657 RepID=A0A1Y2AAM3_9PLEO|nr:glycoside hydrolase superfamily [Clohesyomyces aquaticus]